MQSNSYFNLSSLTALVAATAALTLAFAANAQTMGPGGSAATTAKDMAAMEAAFTRADADKDGSLSAQEVGRMPAIAAKFGELDVNKDGVLSKTEFSAGYFAAQ